MAGELPPFGVAVPAAGAGRRMGGVRKQYLELAGRPVLLRALGPFLDHPAVVGIAVALPEDDVADPPSWLAALSPAVTLVPGGDTRRDSVAAALEALPGDTEILVVHDGARPLVDGEVVEACVRTAANGVGAVAGCPARDTVKETDDEGRVVATPDRSRLWLAQTPQAFPGDLILRAYREGIRDGVEVTDDAALVERLGVEIRMVRSSPGNLKVTRPEDLAVAETLLRRRERV